MNRNRLARLERCAVLRPRVVASSGPPLRLRTAADVVALLEEQIESVRQDPLVSPVERARAIGSLARVALDAIAAANLAGRIEALEAVLARRAGT